MTTTYKKRGAQRGFTLIETVVYLALFAIIIGGAIVAAYQVFESSGRNQTRAMLQEEGGFIIAKVNWVLSGMKTMNVPFLPVPPALCSTDTTLSVDKWDASANPVVIAFSGSDITFTKAGNAPEALHNSNIVASGLSFTRCSSGSANPESVEARFTLSAHTPDGALMSQDFFTTEYARK